MKNKKTLYLPMGNKLPFPIGISWDKYHKDLSIMIGVIFISIGKHKPRTYINQTLVFLRD